MAINRLQRYIAFNVSLWLAVFVCALAILAGARQYGAELSARRTAVSLVKEAEVRYNRNSLFDCQRLLSSAMAIHPPVASEIVHRFGSRLLGLPVVEKRLMEVMRSDPHKQPLAEAAEAYLLEGDSKECEGLLETAIDAAEAPREATFALARIALEQGDFEAARDYFGRYWSGAATERTSVVARTLSQFEPLAQNHLTVGWRLFQWGLWKEAFLQVDAAKAQGDESPGRRFFDGVRQDMDGQKDAAAIIYREVLSTMPNHWLALKRLAILESS